ncbi:MAG: hypothetical protein OEU54_04900 [Gemmatimonadota bacterium]|nr:hypothetical protein [Gemmatimonadota bacterium]
MEEERRSLLDGGFDAVSLGPRTLRFETAAAYGLSVEVSMLESRRTHDEESHGVAEQ